MKRLSKKDKAILNNLDRLLAEKPTKEPHSFLEDKLLQVLKAYEHTAELQKKEQESISHLMSDISHQIKTPLSALSLHLSLAGDSSLNDEERSSELEECVKQAEKIQFLSDAIFKVARLETGLIAIQKSDEDIVDTIQSAVTAIQPVLVSNGLSLKLSLPDSLILPHDPVWTKEAISNLLDNAIKYTENGDITVLLEQGAIYTRIDVTDTGIGIAPRDYTNIFARFYRVRHKETNHIEGTGLGLSIAREILRQQGGNITVSSNQKGTTFSVFLQNC